MLDTLSPEEIHAHHRRLREAAWNALIPPCVIKAEVKPWGVRYLHPTKGYKTVGKRRFAIRGVL
jgi:hypothetical protein